MAEHHRWKNIIQYTVGILLLVCSIAAAMIVPGWYAEWQDERILDSVTLSNRDNIAFLDVDSLDIEGRLKMLQEAKNMEVGELDSYIYTTESDMWKKLKGLLAEWCSAGILPEEIGQYMEPKKYFEENMMLWAINGIYLDQGVLPVCTLRFFISYDQRILMTVIMDAEKDMLYYVSFSGEYAMDTMAKEEGYDSLYDMQQKRQALEAETEAISDDFYSTFDFASVCGAEKAEISGGQGPLELDAALQFEGFDSHAYRRIVSSEEGFGLAAMYGTERWAEIVPELLMMYGYAEMWETPDSWHTFAEGNLGVENYSGSMQEEKYEKK